MKKTFKALESKTFGLFSVFTPIIERLVKNKQEINNLDHQVEKSVRQQQIGVNMRDFHNTEAIRADYELKDSITAGQLAQARMENLKCDMFARLFNEINYQEIDPQLITIMQVLIYKKEEGGDILSAQAEYEKLKAEAELIREEVEQQKIQTLSDRKVFEDTWK